MEVVGRAFGRPRIQNSLRFIIPDESAYRHVLTALKKYILTCLRTGIERRTCVLLNGSHMYVE